MKGFRAATCSGLIKQGLQGNSLILDLHTEGGEDPGVQTHTHANTHTHPQSPPGGHDGIETGAENQSPHLLYQPPDN